MFKNKLILWIFFLGFHGFSQVKKVVDTVYIYEEVIVYDTVYIKKPLERMRFEKIIISPKIKGIKPFVTFIENNKKVIIPVDSLVFESKPKPFENNWEFGAKFITGIQTNTLFKTFKAKPQLSYGLGIFLKKTLFHKNLSVGIGVEVGLLNNNINEPDSTSTSFLNGYYFTNGGNVKLFKSISNKGFQFQIPLQLYWKIKKFTPSVGVFGNLSNYESTFVGSSGNLPLTLDENQNYSARMYFFGYLAQLEYSISKKWSAGINYAFARANTISFKQGAETIAIDKEISQNSFGINLLYHF